MPDAKVVARLDLLSLCVQKEFSEFSPTSTRKPKNLKGNERTLNWCG